MLGSLQWAFLIAVQSFHHPQSQPEGQMAEPVWRAGVTLFLPAVSHEAGLSHLCSMSAVHRQPYCLVELMSLSGMLLGQGLLAAVAAQQQPQALSMLAQDDEDCWH